MAKVIESRNQVFMAQVAMRALPVFADNAAAKAGLLVDGDLYRTPTGVLMVVYT